MVHGSRRIGNWGRSIKTEAIILPFFLSFDRDLLHSNVSIGISPRDQNQYAKFNTFAPVYTNLLSPHNLLAKGTDEANT